MQRASASNVTQLSTKHWSNFSSTSLSASHSKASTTPEHNSSSFVVESIVMEMENDSHGSKGIGKPQWDDEGQIDDGSQYDKADDVTGNMEVIDEMENAEIAQDEPY
eukprot:gene11073-19934_t